YAKHAGDSTVIDGRVSAVTGDRFGVVLLDECVDVSECFQAVANLALILRRLRSHPALQEGAGQSTYSKEDDETEKCPAGRGGHSGGSSGVQLLQAPPRHLAGRTWAKV